MNFVLNTFYLNKVACVWLKKLSLFKRFEDFIYYGVKMASNICPGDFIFL